MADSLKPIPEHWKLVTQKNKDGSKISVYKCQETGQTYYKYEDLMRYINYAKVAKLGVYDPHFGQRCPSSKRSGGSVVGDNSAEKSAVIDSDFEIPHFSSSELAPAEEKTVVLDEHSEAEGDPKRDIETDGSSTEENKMHKKKYSRRHKGKKVQRGVRG